MNWLLLIFILCSVSAVLSQDPRGSLEHHCYVQSPVDFSAFNFTTVQDDHIDSIIRLNENEYLRVHFCRALKDSCNGKEGYAVCFHADDREFGVGKAPPTVRVEHGKIMFRYIGDRCTKTRSYTVDIEMKCNFTAKAKITDELDIAYNRDKCSFQTSIETSTACTNRKWTLCELTDKSGHYNLRPLMNPADNYKIKLNNTLSVILNVCHSLLDGQHFEECDHGTMICLVNETIKPRRVSYTRLGNVNNDVRLSADGGSVFMDLTSDTPCGKVDADEFKTIRTTIEFVCNQDATNTLPKYISGVGTCHYKFRWITVLACSEDSLNKQSHINHEPCKIVDPFNGHLYDLTKLSGTVYQVNSTDTDAVYEFSVCSPLQKSVCNKTGTGICKHTISDQKTGVSKGLANANLILIKNQVFLKYTDGMECGKNQLSYTTITFYCLPTEVLYVDDEDPCAILINWSTPLVCNFRCATPDYDLNLEKLGRHTSNYLVQGGTSTTQFQLNVCQPLVDDNFTNCTNGTGVCKVVVDDEGQRISEINLGYPDFGLHKANDGQFYLRYENGSICEEDESKRISSEITFTCDHETHAVGHIFFSLGDSFFTSDTFLKYLSIMTGSPIFKSYNNCKYDFIWKTDMVCPKTDEGFSKECLLANKIEIYDLALVIKNSEFNISRKKSSGSFNVTVCGHKDTCNGTFVCDKLKGFKPQLHRPKQLITFKFANETQCKNNIFYNALRKLWCEVWDGVAESFLLKEGECSIDLAWARTSKTNNSVCKGYVTANDGALSSILLIISLVIVPVLGLIFYVFYRCGYKCPCLRGTHQPFYRYMALSRRPRPTEDMDLQSNF